jgi:succinoglycan biosynthesis transport protein ExoP
LQSGSLPSSEGPFVPQPEDQPASLDIGALIGGVLRRWKLIIAFPLVLLPLAYVTLKVIPSRYQSTVQLLMFDPQAPNAAVPGEHEASGRDFDSIAVNTEIEIMTSATMLLKVAKELKLDQQPEFQLQSRITRALERLGISGTGPVANILQKVLAPLGVKWPGTEAAVPDAGATAAATEQERLEFAVNMLDQRIKVKPVPNSYVLAVSAVAQSPVLAQQLATSLVNRYLADEEEAREKALGQVAIWLSGKIAELKTRLAESQTSIEKLKAASGLSDTSKGGKSLVEQQITDLNSQLMVARTDVAEKRARLEQARQASGGNSDAATSPVLSQLRLQQSLLTRQLTQLRAKLGDNHSEVIALSTQLAGINKVIGDETARAVADLESNYDIALRREQSIEAELSRTTLGQVNSGDVVKLQQLQSVAEADNKLYDAYVAQYNEIETRKSLGNVGQRVISPATVPNNPIFPPRTLLLIGATVLGTGLGVVVAFLLNFFQAGAKLGAEAERAFGYPVVGSVPLMPQPRSRRFRRSGDNRSLARAIVGEPLSPFSESVRAIRMGLRFSSAGRRPQVVLVTSSLPGEGKSTLSTLLAASSAGAGHRTVLIDCDIRGRTVSAHFGKHQAGLTELLSDKAELAAVTVRDPDIGCDVIPAGANVQSPADLLASSRMAETVDRLRASYDYIVVDSPPLLPFVDALALATIADRILVTIDGSYAHDVSVTEAFRKLRPETHRVAGMVFNKVMPEQMRRYGLYGEQRYAYPTS